MKDSLRKTLAKMMNVLADVIVESGNYTPTITGGSGFAYNNANFVYLRMFNVLYISGRFNITSVATTDSSIIISLPSGFTAKNSGVGAVGPVTNNSGAQAGKLSTRCDGGTTFWIQLGAGGYASKAIGTGYVQLGALIFLVGGYCVTQLLQGLQRFSHRSCLGVM